ncbi:hypothetical protein GCM10027290_12850 [Micromonospora sonneratiae]
MRLPGLPYPVSFPCPGYPPRRRAPPHAEPLAWGRDRRVPFHPAMLARPGTCPRPVMLVRPGICPRPGMLVHPGKPIRPMACTRPGGPPRLALSSRPATAVGYPQPGLPRPFLACRPVR